ncbi:MAG: histone deacetylase family protein [Pseudomonadota bacterium]
MLTIFSPDHQFQDGNAELVRGHLVKPYERPQRAELIIKQVRQSALGQVEEPQDYGIAPIAKVHDPAFIDFLEQAWARWSDLGRTHDALPLCWPVRNLGQAPGQPPLQAPNRLPESIDGQLSYFSFDAGTPIIEGTWRAITASVNTAIEGAERLIKGEKAVFSLCRPPGHHAHRDFYGGYCFFNNAAIAAQYLLDRGCARVSILDVDYHHGNGTQALFYERGDVQFLSLHGDPKTEFPFFLGYGEETGHGPGLGHNHNFPMPAGTGWAAWLASLTQALERIADYAPDALIVSLGVDTYKDDPISAFTLDHDDYPELGALIAGVGRPTLFVMAGGYAIDAIGVNTVNVLSGFDSANAI